MKQFKEYYQGNIKAALATALLVVILFGASFAYFTDFNKAVATYNTTVGNMANVIITYPESEELSLTIDPVNLENSCSVYSSNDIFGTGQTMYSQPITVTNNSGVDITCDFELWYDPVNPYYKSSANVNNLMELGFNYTINGSQKDFDLTDITKPTKLGTFSLSAANGATNESEDNEFFLRHLSYCKGHPQAFDQTEQMGKTFKGIVRIKAAGCKKAPSLSEAIMAKAGSGEYTSSQDGSKYKIKAETVTNNNQTLDAGIRYQGKNPDNYLSFRGEVWRIIGVFEGSTIGMETGKYYTKIILNSSLQNSYWNDRTYDNIWQSSTAYYNLSENYFYNFYVDDKEMVAQDVTWHLGGIPSEAYNSYAADDYFIAERGTVGGAASPTTTSYLGSIGLMYPSDYGYAMYAGAAQPSCSKSVSIYNQSTLQQNCAAYNWLLPSDYEWTISPSSSGANDAIVLGPTGGLSEYSVSIEQAGMRPVLYLQSDLGFTGTGKQSDQYVLRSN